MEGGEGMFDSNKLREYITNAYSFLGADQL